MTATDWRDAAKVYAQQHHGRHAEPDETPSYADGIYATPETLTLVAGGRVRSTAVATAYGYHITLGRTLSGTQRLYRRDGDGNRVPQTVARAPRCAWWSVPDRAAAVKGLLYMAARLGYPLPGVA